MDLRGAETGMEREKSPETKGQSENFNCSEEITGRFQVGEECISKKHF